MKVALISMRPKLADKKSNLKKMKNYITKTKAELYIFGETTLTGYPLKDELRDVAESINGSSIQYMKKIAIEKKCYIIFGLPLKDKDIDGLIHNAAVLIHPNGNVDDYHKWFLINFGPFEEKLYYDEGENLNISKTKFGKIAIIICYDLYFPELCKAYSLQGADIIVCISASPSTTRYFFETILPSRAIENTVFMLYSNIVGTQEELVFWGGSQAYSPLGKLLVRAPYYKENIITCDIDMSQIKLARPHRQVIRDVRCDKAS
jgi:predicted amidohydrolase